MVNSTNSSLRVETPFGELSVYVSTVGFLDMMGDGQVAWQATYSWLKSMMIAAVFILRLDKHTHIHNYGTAIPCPCRYLDPKVSIGRGYVQHAVASHFEIGDKFKLFAR